MTRRSRFATHVLLGATMLRCASSSDEKHTALAERPAVAAPDQEVATDIRLSPREVREDLEALYRSLRSAHYNLYALRSKTEYDAYYEGLISRLSNRPMTPLDLVREFQPFAAFGHIGHARLEFPAADYVKAAQRGGTVLPFDIRVAAGRVFITHGYRDRSPIQPGVELLTFGGQPIDEVLVHISRYVSGERPYMINAQLERFFPRWWWVANGDVHPVEVTGRTPDGRSFRAMVEGLPIGEVETRKSEWTEALATREVRLLGNTAYLRPGPFYEPDGADSLDVNAFHRFVDDAFARILNAKCRALLIDLRDNPGGDNSFSDLLVAWFANRPFRFSDDFSIKVSPEIRRHLEAQLTSKPDDDGIVARMVHAMRDQVDGAIVHIELPMVAPRPERFRGAVFVLVNRHSYSNATSVAAMVQDYGFANILGEETADLPTSYASSAQFTLPNSGLAITFPKGYFVRTNGDTSLSGVIPDVPIPVNVVVDGPDAVLAAAIDIVDAHTRAQP